MPGLLADQSGAQDDVKQIGTASTPLPKGVVLDKDGKPCRTCTSTAAWKAMMKSSTKPKQSSMPAAFSSQQSQSQSQSQTTTGTFAAAASSLLSRDQAAEPNDCPPDVDELGRSTWTLLHTLTATYPTSPTPTHQKKTQTFLSLFSQLYPCWVCAEDFQDWMADPSNDPAEAVKSQEKFGQWMCRAHNAVNVKLGKEEFDCKFWKERWKDGWKDGRCE